jgi:putative PIN family toxin of toxin-antitoxin system
VTRLVLDTNVRISALLFRSQTAALHAGWKAGRFRLAVSPSIVDEYARVLAYPRFGLSRDDAEGLLANEVLPYCDVFDPVPGERACRDADDDKFLDCAAAARADAVVSGDNDLLSLGPHHRGIPLITVRSALSRFLPQD